MAPAPYIAEGEGWDLGYGSQGSAPQANSRNELERADGDKCIVIATLKVRDAPRTLPGIRKSCPRAERATKENSISFAHIIFAWVQVSARTAKWRFRRSHFGSLASDRPAGWILLLSIGLIIISAEPASPTTMERSPECSEGGGAASVLNCHRRVRPAAHIPVCL